MTTIKNIDISAMRTFIAVAELGQVTKAAKRLNITQSAASQQVSRLEYMLGTDLLTRTANRVKLSTNGELIYQKAKLLIKLNDEILFETQLSPQTCEVVLGVPHDLVERVMPWVLKRFSKDHPSVEVKLVSLSTGNLKALLKSGGLDLTLTTELADYWTRETLFEDRLVWAGALSGQASSASPLVVALGDETDQFAGPARRALDQAGLAWKSIRQQGGLGSVLAMLAADIAIAPFLASAIPDFLTAVEPRRLPELPLYHVKLLAHSGRMTAEQEALMVTVRDYFDNHCRK